MKDSSDYDALMTAPIPDVLKNQFAHVSAHSSPVYLSKASAVINARCTIELANHTRALVGWTKALAFATIVYAVIAGVLLYFTWKQG